MLQAAGALQSLIKTEVWCYYNTGDQVCLIRMDDGRMIHKLSPNGGTPSGLAIIGVALGMKKGGVVIHLTDGEHNHGASPWEAHWILDKKGITLLNLLWGTTTNVVSIGFRGFKPVKHYTPPMNIRNLKGLADFPDALFEILVEQSKVKMGGR